ncbi:MAG: transcription-repair coupling factor, partial [Pseudomonadota bacterium]
MALTLMLFSSTHTRSRYTRLHGSSDALALAEYAAQHAPLVVIAASALEAQRLVEEIPFFNPALRVYLLPDWETLPYDHFSPHQDLISERLATLHHIRSRSFDITVVPITTALYPLPPVEYLAAYTFFLKRGDRLDIARLREQLTLAGYSHVQQVLTPGEYCVRGGLVDLFPMGSTVPYRIDLFDDEIETIATFDVDTQRTIYPVPEIRLLPAREFPLDEAGQARFRQNFRERFEGDPSRAQVYRDVSKGIASSGIEYYLPLFFERTATLFDYLPAGSTLCLHHEIERAITTFTHDAATRYKLLRGDPQRPLLEPRALFLSAEDFFKAVKNFTRLDIVAAGANSEDQEEDAAPDGGHSQQEKTAKNLIACATAPLPDIAVNRRAEIPIQPLQNFLQSYPGRVLLVADSLGRREIISGYLNKYGLVAAQVEGYAQFLASSNKFALSVATLQHGFMLTDDALAIITESELYAAQPRSRVA